MKKNTSETFYVFLKITGIIFLVVGFFLILSSLLNIYLFKSPVGNYTYSNNYILNRTCEDLVNKKYGYPKDENSSGLTNVDKAFFIELRDDGVSKENAIEALKEAKTSIYLEEEKKRLEEINYCKSEEQKSWLQEEQKNIFYGFFFFLIALIFFFLIRKRK